MAVNYNPGKLYDTDYTLGILCSEFFVQFGEKAEKIISRICHQRGLALGERLVAKQKNKSFENAIKAFVAASEKSNAPAKLISLEKKRAVLQGTVCPMGLKGRGRKICETMMAMDQGILEKASGKKIKFTVNKTVAAGDNYCDVTFEVV
jgi:predicted hydrocarbon binding protein